MKKLMIEYANIIAYTITGLVFGFSFFLLFLNFYHYREVNEVYIKQTNDDKVYDEVTSKLTKIKENTAVFNYNDYKGGEDSDSLASIKSRLEVCTNSIDTKEFNSIMTKKKINIKDVYDMQQFYQKQISNECLVKQLYELSLDPSKNNLKITNLKTISPFIEDNINQLIKSTDYVQKTIKGNSSYYFSSESSKIEVYNQTKDSYYSILNNYVSAIDFVYDVSEWYKNVVGGI